MGDRGTSAAVADDGRRLNQGALVALLSLLVPGLGQLAVGARRRGLIMLAVTAVLLAAGFWQRLQGPAGVLELLIRPGGLAGILVGNALLALFRVYATLDAFRLGVGDVDLRALRRMALVGAVVALTLATLAPHALALHYTLVAHDTLSDVFAQRQEPTLDATMRPGSADEAGRASNFEQDRRDNPWLEHDRLTVAVLGSDAAPSRSGHRLDAMLVVSVHPASGRVAIFSIERHLRDFPLPERLRVLWEEHCRSVGPGWELLNALYRCGDEVIASEVAELYPAAPNPAAAAVADTLGTLLGLPVDHYVMVDMKGFVELVDALGGLELDLYGPPRTKHDEPADECDWRSFDIRPQSRELDGEGALELMRDRTDTTSADRMARQRCMLVTLSHQMDAPTLLRRFGQLADVVREHVVTSIPLDALPGLTELLPRVDLSRITTVGFDRPNYVSAEARPDVERIRVTVEHALEPPSREVVRRYLDGPDPT